MSDGYSIANMIIPSGVTRIKLLKSVIVEGMPGVQVGQSFEVSHSIARTLINMGAAVEDPAEPTKKVNPPIETRDPQIEHRDPIVAQAEEKQPRKSSARKPAK